MDMLNGKLIFRHNKRMFMADPSLIAVHLKDGSMGLKSAYAQNILFKPSTKVVEGKEYYITFTIWEKQLPNGTFLFGVEPKDAEIIFDNFFIKNSKLFLEAVVFGEHYEIPQEELFLDEDKNICIKAFPHMGRMKKFFYKAYDFDKKMRVSINPSDYIGQATETNTAPKIIRNNAPNNLSEINRIEFALIYESKEVFVDLIDLKSNAIYRIDACHFVYDRSKMHFLGQGKFKGIKFFRGDEILPKFIDIDGEPRKDFVAVERFFKTI